MKPNDFRSSIAAPHNPLFINQRCPSTAPHSTGKPVLGHIDAWVFILQCQGGYITCAASQENPGKNQGQNVGEKNWAKQKLRDLNSSKAEKFPTPHGKDGGGKMMLPVIEKKKRNVGVNPTLVPDLWRSIQGCKKMWVQKF